LYRTNVQVSQEIYVFSNTRANANFLELRKAEVQLRRIFLPRTWLNGPLPCLKRRGFKKEVEHIVPANGAFIRPCVPLGWWPALQR
jgi:hypothetical protein